MGLRDLVDFDFSIGTAASWGQLSRDRQLREIVSREFNLLTPMNEFKMKVVRPNPTQYDFASADAIVEFAIERQMAIRGTSFVWYPTVPSWLGRLTTLEVEAVLKQYIFEVMRRYRGQIAAWDIVNEAFTDEGLFRNSFWLATLGAEYIFKAYKWAYEADPDALLFYSDYRLHLEAKQKILFQMVRELRDRGIPIHGIAIQTHHKLSGAFKILWLARFIEQMKKQFRLIPHLSEITFWVNPGIPDALALEIQALAYRQLMAFCLQHDCKTFNIWGVTDKYVWRHPQTQPFLFDRDYQPKLAYRKLAELLSSQ